jgi:hypothetical protein
MNPIMIAKSAAIILITLAVFYTGKQVEKSYWLERENQIKEEVMRQVAESQLKADKAANDFALSQAALNKLKINSTERVLNEVNKNSSDYACRIPDGGLRLISSAIREANSPQ